VLSLRNLPDASENIDSPINDELLEPLPMAHDSPIMCSSLSLTPPLHLLDQLHNLQITMQWSPNPDIIHHLDTANQLMHNHVMNLESELNQAVEGECHQHE
jgi:hypothetical protein